jgi:hypothetical protein
MAEIADYSAVERYRSLYDTKDKLDMLADELVELGLFSSIDATDPQAVERHNIACEKLYRLGIIQDEMMKDIVDAIWRIDYKKNSKEKKDAE